jgi:DNA-binding NtrC family response regulator
MSRAVSPGRSAILVVDDDPEVREILAETLTEFGYRVLQAGTGEEALPFLEARGEVGMIITDVRMPGMSGLEFVERAKAHDPAVKVIVMSGYFISQSVGARFLKKPFHMHELASAVRAEFVEPQPRSNGAPTG